MLASNLAKQGLTADAKVKPHEVKTAAWSYALAVLEIGAGEQAPRLSGLAIAVPDKKDPTKWMTVAASYNAL
jgi:hypothetical protein